MIRAIIALTICAPAFVFAEGRENCRLIEGKAERLACYDRAFGRSAEKPVKAKKKAVAGKASRPKAKARPKKKPSRKQPSRKQPSRAAKTTAKTAPKPLAAKVFVPRSSAIKTRTVVSEQKAQKLLVDEVAPSKGSGIEVSGIRIKCLESEIAVAIELGGATKGDVAQVGSAERAFKQRVVMYSVKPGLDGRQLSTQDVDEMHEALKPLLRICSGTALSPKLRPTIVLPPS